MLKLVLLISFVFTVTAQARGLSPVPMPAVKVAAHKPASAAHLAKPGKNTSVLKSFREWKFEKIQASLAQVDQATRKLQDLRSRPRVPKAAVEHTEQQLAQEAWNLEIAQDLSVTDYLVLYLAQQGVVGKFNEAASKLTADETAQVLEAYVRDMIAVPSHGQRLLPSSAIQNR
ncbi:MAG: hypothetical protein ACK5P7_11585 [Bdellovibrio sp.]|jgi:hypothetical protein